MISSYVSAYICRVNDLSDETCILIAAHPSVWSFSRSCHFDRDALEFFSIVGEM